MSPLALISGRLERLNGRRILFVPVLLAFGIGGYFGLPREPTLPAWVALGLIALALAGLGWRFRQGRYAGLASLAAALALVVAGALVAGLRTAQVRAPVLDFHYYGAVEGRIVTVDRSQSDAVRLTLDRVRLDRVAPAEVPARVRVSLHGAQGYIDPAPGLRVAMTAFLSGPEGPVEPGGFDFRRMAWFDRIGAVGYSRAPVLALAPADDGWGGLLVSRLRARVGSGVRAALPGEAGAFAAAVTTGDRSAMDRATIGALRRANLAHLLAISGLHMGLITGFVFAALRLGLALVPGFAARFPARKVAAVGALQAGAFYLALSGGNVATERAFIMVSVMFGAVLLDRRALTLRAVALAAIVILLLQPEALTEPGFQMSFAATTALVAAFGTLRDWRAWRPPRWAQPVLATVISSAVAGLATAPFAAAHFNQVPHYGLIANLLAVPVMGALVMPLAVLAAVLWPVGLSGLALWLMRWPILWILGVARWVAGLDGAVGHVLSPPGAVLPLIALGALALVLLRGGGRALGLVPMIVGFLIWGLAERPPVLVADGGGLVGLLTAEGRALSKPRGNGFAANVWLENDGDPVPQDEAAARPGFAGDKGLKLVELGNLHVAQLSGRGAADRLAEACGRADLVILTVAAEAPVPGCRYYDAAAFEATGALAIWPEGARLQVETVAERAGLRPWTRP